MDGILVVRKPRGCTSHDVVALFRKRFRIKRVGHAGTLDPLAEGALVLLVGKATRLAEYISGHTKTYAAGLLLGRATDTEDVEGEVLLERDSSGITREMLENTLKSFTGRLEQLPPMYSAVKVDGKRLYEIARKGKSVERQRRSVEVFSIELASFESGNPARAELVCTVSAGTYIRTLCADIGENLGVGGCMEYLTRTSSGPFSLKDAVELETLRSMEAAELAGILIPPQEALAGVPSITLNEEELTRVGHGQALRWGGDPEETVMILDEAGELKAVARIQGDPPFLRPVKVFMETNGQV